MKTLANLVEEKRKRINNQLDQPRNKILFVKKGEKPDKEKRSQKCTDSFLNSATDWKLEVDLGGRLKVPAEITTTDLRPDMMLISHMTKQVSFIELTLPSEESIEVSGELKKAKYEAIAVD